MPLTEGFNGLYNAYQQWCKDGGMHALSKIKLTQQIERVVSTTGGVFVKDNRLVMADGQRSRVTYLKGIRLIR